MNKTSKMVLLAIMLSFSLVLYYIENMLPPINLIAPGAKLGLSNIISLTCLYVFGFKEAFVILFMRIFLSSTFYGGISTFMYSISGGILSIIAMGILKKLDLKSVSMIGISVVGALFFNVGQLLVASFMISNTKIFYYLPYMSFISIATGIFIGITSQFLTEHLKKIIKKN
ncbi:heptaprenyl diphosphate synthase component I [Peptoanaerobacter stomatis]|jgi:heptaprenyl diphosphate synthase component I|uniref:Heptaprenyl diphosphate synthase component I n=1 Tax=Peptoanaerobacter stomatis TaxID=796937 RepID=J4W0T6_9FIRM|nr:Gx transporter family protein [Peptoanaerobacter stomatis]EJU19921.1 heptaprenyl diphosphate synthase component I [Peptoanaerobacter stomatis]NWO26136.1 Gx transporter family protein [Peptostreptococcaceae bacterium oral taxon 081]